MKKHHKHLHPHKVTHYVVGIGICFVGSSVALHAADIQMLLPVVPHVAIDAFAYALHGIGTIPFVSTLEAFFD